MRLQKSNCGVPKPFDMVPCVVHGRAKRDKPLPRAQGEV